MKQPRVTPVELAVHRYVKLRRMLFEGVVLYGFPFDAVWKAKDEAFAVLVKVEGGTPFAGSRGAFLEDAFSPFLHQQITQAITAAMREIQDRDPKYNPILAELQQALDNIERAYAAVNSRGSEQ